MGLRPEHLTLDDRARLRGRVYLVEPMGADAWVTVELAQTRVIARCEGAVALKPGVEVGLHFERSKLHWFDATTELSRE